MHQFNGSRYNILVPLQGGGTLAYNGLSGALAVWDKADSELYADIVNPGADQCKSSMSAVAELRYGGFVVDPDRDEFAEIRQEYERIRNDSSRLVLTIAPTLACNFGCDYCFQGPDKPHGRMSRHVQGRVVELLAAEAPSLRHLNVAWYGGEPLLAPDVIRSLSESIIRIAQDHGISYDAMIVTNGYGLTAAVASELYSHRVTSAQITLDGAEDEHDQRRHLLSGRGSFNRIIGNLQSVVMQVPINISIRVNIDSRNSDTIEALLADLVDAGLSGRRNFGVYFAPVEAITEGCHNVAESCLSKSAYADLETMLTRRAFEAGLSRSPYPPRLRGICGAVRPNGWVVVPNGDLHKCWDTVSMPEQRIGTVFDVAPLAGNERSERWTNWSPFDNEICSSCKLLPNCAGSCAHKFLNQDQTRGEAAELPCPSWKYNINERLIARAVQSGAITASDYDPVRIKTDPREICPVDHSEKESDKRRPRLLPLLTTSGNGCGGKCGS